MTPFDRLKSSTAPAALALACALLMAPPPRSALAETAPAPVVAVGAYEHGVARKIDLSIGKSIIVDLPRDAKEVFVANPKIANAVVRSTRKVFIIGMADGYTSMFAMDAEGRQIATLEINVGRDLGGLRETLRRVLPQTQIDVRSVGDSILLTGIVDSPLQAQQAIDMANAFVGQSTSGGGASTQGQGVSISFGGASTTTGKVLNSITIRGKDQVMLKVTVAEVQRTVLKQLGIDTSGEWRIGSVGITPFVQNPFSVQNQVLSDTAIGGGLGRQSNFTLRAMERQGVLRTLAEPNLTAISGETAKFVAGGEIPIPKGQTCSFDLFNRQLCSVSVEYKQIGVTLNFTPVVLAENRISLRVGTEVTELDSENRVLFGTIAIPAFKTRRLETTIELPSGGTLVSAGLIQNSSKQAINGLPGVMNVPILGTLFRSRDYQHQETELMISVTPFIAKPISPGEVTRPDDGFADATDPQTVFLGRINRLYGVAGAPVNGRAYNGRVGFITD